MAIFYEWLVEELVEVDGDIQDVNHHSDARSMLVEVKGLEAEAKPVSYGIVRDRFNAYGDLECRSWAYVVDGELPTHFEDAGGAEVAKVPAKFVREFSKAKTEASANG